MNERFVIASVVKLSTGKELFGNCFHRKALAMVCLFFLLLPFISLSQTSEKSLNKEEWQFRKIKDKEWLPASVPGTVHTDLLNNKLIPDPFFGDNEKKLQWIENEDWEYKTSFDISKKELLQHHIELQFDGLDTYASVFLNDSLILSADNMFRSWNIDVKKFVHKGKNKLRIVFAYAINKGKEEAKKLPYTLPGDEKVFVRKAQYQFGWDFGPRFVTCGIYKDVKLIFWNDAKILNIRCVQKSLTDTLATLEFVCEFQSDTAQTYFFNVLTRSTDEVLMYYSKEKIAAQKGFNVVSVLYHIRSPKLWWTNGLGEQKLYLINATLSNEKEIVDEKEINIGLRTIELVQQPDSIGTSFYFKLNGVPVFMKGANYIPPDNFLPRVSKIDYEKIIDNAVDANMNMLRVWGGGVYADDAFYNACDKKGILVWQDMMFACAMYPGDEHFINNVEQEIREQVLRLQNHPSIALWCGNNEIEEGWKNWGWQQQYHYSQSNSTKIWDDYEYLFKKRFYILTKDQLHSPVCWDKDRAYISSSPQIGWGHKESLLQGDSHYWGVWWGMEPFDVYKQKVGRFVSEYGFQGMPSLNTFEKMGNFQSSLDSISFKSHQKHPTGYQTIKTYMERDYKVPVGFENYIYVSQLLQAEGMKIAIEAHRRAKPICMGSLYWQLNDCWSGTTWSSIDYYGNWKASHYQAKRSYEKVIVSVNEENNLLKTYIVNDGIEWGRRKLWFRLMDFKGNIIWSKMKDVTMPANNSTVVDTIDKKEFGNFDPKQTVLSVSLMIPKAFEIANTLYYFVKPKDLVLQKPEIKINVDEKGLIHVSSTTFAKDVFIESNGEEYRMSDNYFDLLPNETKTIYIQKGYEKALPDNAKLILHSKSLYDSYQRIEETK